MKARKENISDVAPKGRIEGCLPYAEHLANKDDGRDVPKLRPGT